MPGVVTPGSEAGMTVKVQKNFIAVTSFGIWGAELSVAAKPWFRDLLCLVDVRGVWGLDSQLIPVGLHPTEATK